MQVSRASRRRLHACKAFHIPSQLDFFRQVISPRETTKVGPLEVSTLGLGTWAWGNRLLWGYDESMDGELQQVVHMLLYMDTCR